MTLTRPFAYHTGTTIPDMDQVGDLAVGPTYNNEWRYDLDYGGVKWYMGADEELGYMVARENIGKYKPRFKRSPFTEQGYLDMVNELSVELGGPVFYGTLEAKNWINSQEFWQNYTGGTAASPSPTPIPTSSVLPTPSITPTVSVSPSITPTVSVSSSITPTPTPSSTSQAETYFYIYNGSGTTYNITNVTVNGQNLIDGSFPVTPGNNTSGHTTLVGTYSLIISLSGDPDEERILTESGAYWSCQYYVGTSGSDLEIYNVPINGTDVFINYDAAECE